MRRGQTTSLREADVIATPATTPATTGAKYVAALRSLASGKKQPVSVGVFERWIDSRHGLNQPFSMDESVMEQFREELHSGKFRSESRRKYRALARQAPADVFRLHNRMATMRGPVRRPLLDSHRYGRLKVFAALTPKTRRALVWFHESGTRTLKSGRQQLMTQATRNGALAAALSVLQHAGVNGLEIITKGHVARMQPQPDPADPEFRRVTRMLYTAGVVYRACVQKGLLRDNPMEGVDSSIFAAYADRDFLPPGEVDRVRDLSTVDTGNADQVRDRLVMLLLVDTAMRKSELAGIQLSDVRRIDGGSYQIRLESGAQKMTGKPAAFIGSLYPETQSLLSRYLAEIRPHSGGSRLIVDGRGNDATAEGIYRAVVREGQRLNLRCYHSNQRPGCHDLRRTFATVNAAPLGLRLTTAELAERMRTSYDIVYQHYVVQNPLRASMNEEEYRKRLSADPVRQCLSHVEALDSLGIEGALLEPIRRRVHEMQKPAEPVQVDSAERDWIPEAEATALLAKAWTAMPTSRTFREYIKSQSATCRRGNHGGLHMDAAVIRDLVDGYIPADDFVEMCGQARSSIPEKYMELSIGRLRLVRRVNVAALLKDVGNGRCHKDDLRAIA